MIRKAILKDVNSIEDTYNEHFQYELNHTAFTVFRKGFIQRKMMQNGLFMLVLCLYMKKTEQLLEVSLLIKFNQ